MATTPKPIQPSDVQMAAPPGKPRGRQPGQLPGPPVQVEITMGERPKNQVLRWGSPSPPRRPLNWFIQRVIDETLDRPEDTPEQAKERADKCCWIVFDADVVKRLTNQIQSWNGRKRSPNATYPGVKITWSYAFDADGKKTHVGYWAVRKPDPMPADGEASAESKTEADTPPAVAAPPPTPPPTPPRNVAPAAQPVRGPVPAPSAPRWSRS